MAVYPFPFKIQNEAATMSQGNFGLWYNKYVPLSRDLKSSDEQGDETKAVECYLRRYQVMKNAAVNLLHKKHLNQAEYCASFPDNHYEAITVRAMLKTPLITGIGETHPHEVSMALEHNLGIPFIPASGVKGIVRFAHTISLIDEAVQRDPDLRRTGIFDDEEDWTLIPLIFGTQKRIGRVIFLDAYPEQVPDLKIDIMNPHYGDYYSDPGKTTPPADYLNPKPLKFLTVKEKTVFIFRAVSEKEEDISQKVKDALFKALTEEGVGAKTAVGYGRFAIMNERHAVDDKAIITTKSISATQPAPETWHNAYVSFNAGGGGIITANLNGRKAELRGKEKCVSVTDEPLQKKLFEGKKNIPKADVAVRKLGNNYEIIAVKAPKC